MSEASPKPDPAAALNWAKKFAVAIRGVFLGFVQEKSFLVHLFATAIVIVAGFALEITRLEWCVIALSIAVVLGAEFFNTALERLARAVTREENPDIRDALDLASGAVLVVSVGAAVVGVLVLGNALWGW